MRFARNVRTMFMADRVLGCKARRQVPTSFDKALRYALLRQGVSRVSMGEAPSDSMSGRNIPCGADMPMRERQRARTMPRTSVCGALF